MLFEGGASIFPFAFEGRIVTVIFVSFTRQVLPEICGSHFIGMAAVHKRLIHTSFMIGFCANPHAGVASATINEASPSAWLHLWQCRQEA